MSDPSVRLPAKHRTGGYCRCGACFAAAKARNRALLPLLILLRGEGVSFRLAARELAVSKNTLIGLAQRNGLINHRERPVATIIQFPERGGCVWPIGDPRDADFGFCGAARSGDGPYCAEHRKCAYVPEGKRTQVAAALDRAAERMAGD